MIQYTIGVEEEHQVIDPANGELTPLPGSPEGAKSLVTGDGVLLKRELHTSAVEVDTGICASAAEVETRLVSARGSLHRWCDERGLRYIAAGSHPTSDWKQAEITDAPRYRALLENLQDVGRSNLIYGLHVHVAIDDPARALQVINGARVYLPHLLALSCSSPFWRGRDTGLDSVRTAVFARMPRTGIPPAFHSLEEYQEVVDSLVRTHCIEDATRIWWDLRPHSLFPTVEFRICDIPTRVQDCVTIAALTQAIVAKIDKLAREGRAPRASHRGYVAENKWRAARFGIRGELVDFHNVREQHAAEWLEDLLTFVDDVVDELGSRVYVERARQIVAEGTSADRQRAVYEQSGKDYGAVIQHLLGESIEGVCEDSA